MTNWKQGGDAYLPALAAAEDRYAIPQDLLARIAYQESHWREDIVSGATCSPAGCKGLMQLNPRFFPTAGFDWQVDVDIAGHYLAQLYRQFSDWRLSVAAYNWGPGNVERYKSGLISMMPDETRNYLLDVFSDVQVPIPVSV